MGSEFYVRLEALIRAFYESARREEGQDLIEYALLAALISIAAIGALSLVGPQIVEIFEAVAEALDI